jgi:hypothetical protein
VARTVTRAIIRKNARLYADQRPGGGSTFITDDEYNDLINLELPKLYDRLVSAAGPEFYEEEDTSITTAAGTATYNLPASFYQLNACDLRWSTSPLRLEPVRELEHSADRYRYAGLQWGEGSPKVQRCRKSLIEFFPTPSSAVQVVLRYVPVCPLLTQDSGASGTFDGVNGWDNAVSLGVAIAARGIEKVGANDLIRLYEAELERIDQIAADRASSSAPKVRDVNPEGSSMHPWWADLPPPV